MLAEEYYRTRGELQGKGLLLAFSGYISEGVLFSLGQALRQKMALEERDTNVIKRVFSVFVEQVQNVLRYSVERVEGEVDGPVEMSSGLIGVGRQDDSFFVVCGNVIAAEAVAGLRDRLDHLAALDQKGLRTYYKEKLREPPEEESKGASLGLIEIARRASQPIEYDFLTLEGGQAFFCLKAYI